jgi:hypothetical protein
MNEDSMGVALDPRLRWAIACSIPLALVLVPAPLLPPHGLAEAIQRTASLNWKTSYLLAAIGLRAGFYASLGLLAGLAVKPSPTLRGRLLRIALLPLLVVGVALVIRSMKVGHPPPAVHVLIPSAACFAGAALGLGVLHRAWKATLGIGVVVLGVTFWGLFGRAPGELRRVTLDHIQRVVASGPGLPSGEDRFGALMQAAFVQSDSREAVRDNRAAILALGIAIGHERLARFVGLDREHPLVLEAVALRRGTTLRGREDWSRHYLLSAALAVLENPLLSDAGGLLKEELDALARGTGFSFADLAADRAGVRFAAAATRSAPDAELMQARVSGFVIDDFFPQMDDLPENLTVEEFRRLYGGVGSERYREAIGDIEERLDRCAGLRSGPAGSPKN